MNSDSGEVVLWDTSPPYSQSAGFPNKVATLCPNTVPFDVLASCEGSSMSLGLVTDWREIPLSPRVIWCPDNKQVSQAVMGALDHHCPRIIQEVGSPGSGQRSFPSSPILSELSAALVQGWGNGTDPQGVQDLQTFVFLLSFGNVLSLSSKRSHVLSIDTFTYTHTPCHYSLQSLSRVRLSVTPWTAARQASLSITNSRSLLKFMSIESVMPSNHLILCRPLLLLPSIFPSIRVFSNESALHIRWPKYWNFSFSISPSNEYWGLISFRIDWVYFLAVQGSLKSLIQHYSSKASILQHSAFFIVQLLHPYITTGKTITLTRWTFVGKVMSLFLNMLSRLVITFLPRSKHLLISWLQSSSVVILEPQNIKFLTVSIVSPSICHKVIGLDAMIRNPGNGAQHAVS